jgi:hypothetical protein
VTNRVQSQRFPAKCNSLIRVFGIASVKEAGGEFICKISQQLGPICMTDRTQSQRFPIECNGLIQVFDIASVIKAGGVHSQDYPMTRTDLGDQQGAKTALPWQMQ